MWWFSTFFFSGLSLEVFYGKGGSSEKVFVFGVKFYIGQEKFLFDLY